MTNDNPSENIPTVSNQAGARVESGACHCGAVRFEAEVDLHQPVSRCNCSICTKVGGLTALVRPPAFRLVTDESALASYAFGRRTGTRYFCRTCGVHCFLRGHLDVLGGDYVAINANCLEGVELTALTVLHFDGRHDNWQAGPRPTAWPIYPERARKVS